MPSWTVISPGPTCFQPTRSFPLNSCFHSLVCACEIVLRVIRKKTNEVRQVFMDSPGENYKPLEIGFRGLNLRTTVIQLFDTSELICQKGDLVDTCRTSCDQYH